MESILRNIAKITFVLSLFSLPALTYGQLRIMPLGNSITAGTKPNNGSKSTDIGYRKRLFLALQPAYPGLQFVGSESNGNGGFDQDHEGHPGWKADEIRDNIYLSGEDWLTNNPPHVILLHIGTNDIGAGENLTNIVTEVEAILDRIDQYEADNNTEVVVFVARIIRLLFGSFNGTETTAFNNQIESMVNQRIANGDKLIMVDQESAITYPDALIEDEIHPNQDGYEDMADVWELAINSNLTGPQITDPGILTASPGENFQYQIEATGVPTPEIQVDNLPAGMTYDPATRTVSWIPEQNQQGPASFDVTATNPLGADNRTININVEPVNDPPVFTKGPDITIDEDAGPQEFTNWATGIDDGDNESDQNLTFNMVSVQSSGSNTISPAINANGDLTFTPGENVNGIFTVTISLSDDGMPSQTSAEQTFTITIDPVNDPPAFTLSEESVQLATGFETTQINVLPEATPSDEVSQTVTYSIIPSSVNFADIAIDNTGMILIKPKPEHLIGEQEFAVLANDGQETNNMFVASFILSVDLAVGIEDALKKSVKMYPNPADNILNVQLENGYLGQVNLQLYDLRGGLIKSATYLKTTTLMNQPVDITRIKSGPYLIRVQLDRNEVWNRIIIK
ncbi:MAG: Ig-like domain-containing protein [Cytophagales bacterium]|nr:Ig-like domain-containing protein [Cytophagales bacterium]